MPVPEPRLVPEHVNGHSLVDDARVAAELKARLMGTLGPVLSVMADCRRAGFLPAFQLGVDQMGRDVVLNLRLEKHF